METRVKQEVIEQQHKSQPSIPTDVIDLSDSDEDDAVSEEGEGRVSKRQKLSKPKPVLPAGFLDPLPPLPNAPMLVPPARAVEDAAARAEEGSGQACKQFWKAGDYEGAPSGNWDSYTGGMDHVRVHPKFLHSNATSHKWALGAFAELLDNSLDEVCNGATYVNIDMLVNKKDKSRMLLIEDNGGGMDPEKMRQCMSLGYSAKSKLANTIGQYGNGFKTSTMRLGADVIVFSRCSGKKGKSPTQSIGLLSYTFLRSTGKEDIVVPILDYERRGCWNKVVRSSEDDWKRNVDTIVQWSPYSSEVELLQQFHMMKDQGTRVIIYNLWEDDQGQLELDFDSDRHDIQIRGVNRDERNIQMAKDYPNSRHFLMYRHSLRSYVSILYLRLPPNFRIILRGKDVEHHNVVNDMMMTQEVTYRPAAGAEGAPKDENMVAVVTIGFVKDARAHIDIQGFNVYHKNRLIKPFWRLWNAAGSDGRGVIGVLEANFVEPAHDKQGFERTTVLARLENKLIQMQKTYWSTHCHKIGYAPRRNKKHLSSADCESSPDFIPSSSHVKGKATHVGFDKSYSNPSQTRGGKGTVSYSAVNGTLRNGHVSPARARGNSEEPSSPSAEDVTEDYVTNENSRRRENGSRVQSANNSGKAQPQVARRSLDNGCPEAEGGRSSKTRASSPSKDNGVDKNGSTTPVPDLQLLEQLKEENQQLKERLKKREEEILGNLQIDLEKEREKCKSLEAKLEAAEHRIDELNKEQESLIDIFSEERDRRDLEEESLRKKLKDASNRIQELLDKVAVLEKMKYPNGRR